MKISVAQIASVKGDVLANTIKHKKVIELAAKNGSDVIVFPELSLTGYEPTLGKKLAMSETDSRWNEFQEIANAQKIIIALGAPIKCDSGICISLVVLQPDTELFIYSKRYLHADEDAFFVSGNSPSNLIGKDNNMALAICYEIFIPEHSEQSISKGVEVYIASVAKGESGVKSAKKTLSDIAKKHSVFTLMSNTIGSTDNYISFGSSFIMNNKGELLDELSSDNEGLTTLDTETQKTSKLLL